MRRRWWRGSCRTISEDDEKWRVVGLRLSPTYKCYLLPHPAVNTLCGCCCANINVDEEKMKHLFLLLCLLGAALSVRQDKKINLDDIERDNLKSERKVKQEKQQAKAPAVATSYVEQPQLEAAPQVTYVQQAPPPAAYIQQAPPQIAYAPQTPPQYSYAPVKTVQQYAQQQENVAPQLYSRLPQYELADNSIAQPSYYNPPQQQQQYVYLQPAAQVEPRATIQYVMYIPAPVGAAATQPAAAYVASPKTESLLQSAQEYLNALPPPQAYAAGQEYSYDVPAAAPQRYVQQQPQPQPQPQLQYTYIQQEPPQVNEPAPEAPSSHHHQQQQTVEQQYVAMAPAQPKSLLDSYVPSYLQVQYYKQQQQSQKNSIQEQGKGGLSSITGKTDIVKSQHGSANSYKYQYQIPEY